MQGAYSDHLTEINRLTWQHKINLHVGCLLGSSYRDRSSYLTTDNKFIRRAPTRIILLRQVVLPDNIKSTYTQSIYSDNLIKKSRLTWQQIINLHAGRLLKSFYRDRPSYLTTNNQLTCRALTWIILLRHVVLPDNRKSTYMQGTYSDHLIKKGRLTWQ